jgi:hypothetical protein
MLPGALYGALRDRHKGVEAMRSLAYGLALFVVADNCAIHFWGSRPALHDIPGRHMHGV